MSSCFRQLLNPFFKNGMKRFVFNLQWEPMVWELWDRLIAGFLWDSNKNVVYQPHSLRFYKSSKLNRDLTETRKDSNV